MGMGGLVFTQDALRPLSQAGKRLGCLGARVSGWLRGGDRLATGSGITGPQRAEHEENAHQRHKPEVVEKKSRYHGNAPADGSELRAL